HETGGQSLVQISGPCVSVIHGSDKTGRLMNRNPAVAGNVDHPAEVQDRVEYSQSLVPGHIDLVQDTESPLSGAFIYRTGTEYHLPLPKRVGADHIGSVHVNVKRNVPAGTAENL